MADALLVLIVLVNLSLLGGRRIAGCIGRVAVQGLAVSVCALVAERAPHPGRLLLLAALGVAVKGLLVPWLLRRAMKTAEVVEETRPPVGFTASTVIGLALLGVAFVVAGRLPAVDPGLPPLMLPVAFTTMLSGLLLVIVRKTALLQVIGYLMMENGIFMAGIALVSGIPWLVELGVLLDAATAVLVMSAVIGHISRVFDHVDMDRLRNLQG
ncbi:MAG: NADH-quinone oxidoreductase subunit K [Candidatus Coatesbacteria bacterium]